MLTRQVLAAFAQNLVAMYGLSLVAGLQAALSAVYEDKRRTLPLHVRALSPSSRDAWLLSRGATVNLFEPCPGVDPARSQAEVLCKALFSEVITQHQVVLSAAGEVRSRC